VLANSSSGFLVITECKKFVHCSTSFFHGTKFGKVLICFKFTRKFGMTRPPEQEVRSRVLLSNDSPYMLQNFSQVILFAIFNPLQKVHSFQPGKILQYKRESRSEIERILNCISECESFMMHQVIHNASGQERERERELCKEMTSKLCKTR